MNYFWSIFLGTFVLEDLALVSALSLIAKGQMHFISGFLACFLGIAVGDLLLYFLGRYASKFGIEKHIHKNKKIKLTLNTMKNSQFLNYMIFISRMIPGTRLPTYIGAGLIGYSIVKFFVLTVISVGLWVALALAAGQTLNYLFMDHLLLSLFGFFIFLMIFKSLVPILTNKWTRKAFFQSWRKWQSFEFWPSWFFYIPLVFWYLFLSLKYRSLLNPFYANPKILNGGLLGESKWDFLKYLDQKAETTLPSLKIPAGTSYHEFIKILENENFEFPFILKPDIGQRGFAVRIIRDDFDLTEYLLMSDFDMILQKLSTLPQEAGLFYIRFPNSQNELLFSITDKKFPSLKGDGKKSLGQLILEDQRARIIASTYFARHQADLEKILKKDEVFYLSECGNHCQGAQFFNGEKLKSDVLLAAVSKVVHQIPEFYFGRLDIRYKDHTALKNGHFEIIEINGAGSEATHIWDSETKLLEAYKTLFTQWNLLFLIGEQVKKNSNFKSNLNLTLFLKESYKVYFRKGSLAVSS